LGLALINYTNFRSVCQISARSVATAGENEKKITQVKYNSLWVANKEINIPKKT